MQILTEIDYTTTSTLHKLVDKLLIQSVPNSYNYLDAFKPVFKIGFFLKKQLKSKNRNGF